LLSDLALLLAQLLAQLSASLVLLFPKLGSVVIPVLAEFGREGFGEKKQTDVISPGAEIFLHKARLAVDVVVVLLVVLPTTALVRRRALDVVEIPGWSREERRGEWKEKGKVG
jgi:hypothetical protein